MKVDLDGVTAKYVETREEISRLTKQIDELKALQAKRETWLLGQLQTLGLQNVKTPHGVTVYQTVKESVTVGSWDDALNWVKENDAWEFLTKGVAKSAVLDYLGDRKENPPPPGVNYVATRTVGVRKG